MPRSAADLKTYSVFDLSGGLDVKTSPLKGAVSRRQNTLEMARNCVLSTAGAVSKRFDTQRATTTGPIGGTAQQTTLGYVLTGGLGDFIAGNAGKFLPTLGFLDSSAGGTSTVVVSGGIEYVKSDGTRQIVFGTTEGKLYKLNTNGSVTELASGLAVGTKWYFATYHDLLLIGNRVDAPRKYDGTTVGVLGGSPPTGGGPVCVHGNRVFWLNGVTKSRLTWSALDNEEDYTSATNAGAVDVSPNDGSDLVAFVPSVNELVLLKGARPYRLQGTSPATFTITNVVPTTGSVGAVSPQAAVFALNDVWYLGSPGLTRLTAVQGFGDLRESFPSAPIQPYFEEDTDFTLSLANLDDAVMAYDSQRNRIYVAVDADGDDKNDTVLCYDGATKGWTVWAGMSVASMWPVRNMTTGQTEMYAGGYDGHIRVLNRDVAENAVDAEARHLSALGSPGVEKSVRHGFIYLKEQGNTTVRVDTKLDFGATGGQVFTVSQLGSSHTLGINWVLGQDPLGVQAQIVKRINIHGTGEFFEIGVKNENAGEGFTWYGMEIFYRERRVIRRGTGAAV